MWSGLAALVVLSLTIGLAIDLLFDWSSSERVRGRQVCAIMILVALLTVRICERLLDGTL